MAGERSHRIYSVDVNPNDADQNVDALMSGYAWDTGQSKVITYSFPDSLFDISYDLFDVSWANGFNATQQDVARDVFGQWEAVADIELQETSNNRDGTIRLYDVFGLETARAWYPWRDELAGDAQFSNSIDQTPKLGTWEYYTYLHEIGHALGLEHGHDEGGGVWRNMTDDFNGMEYSVMTYRTFVGQTGDPGFHTNAYGHYAQTPMLFDIAALQAVYGADYGTNSNNTVYTFNGLTGEALVNGVGQGRPVVDVVFRTVWDGGGIDTYDLSNFNTELTVDLSPGGYSDFDRGGLSLRAKVNDGYDDFGNWSPSGNEVWAPGHLYNAFLHHDDPRSFIENAIGGSGDDYFTGNDADNSLNGGAGNDWFMGMEGRDTFIGGSGTDTVEYESELGDFLLFSANAGLQVVGEGLDTVTNSVEFVKFDDQTYTYNQLLNSALVAQDGAVGLGDIVSVALSGNGGGASGQGLAGATSTALDVWSDDFLI